jgi:hypothetical protein
MSARWLVAVAFVASRLIYRVFFGVSLDKSPAHYFLQLLDPRFLEADLLRSVLSLHHQAPLLNLALGLSLKCFGEHAYVALDVAFIALGLWAAVSLADVLERLGLKPLVAAVAAALFACSPTTAIYESWLFYSHLVAALLIIASAALMRWVEAPSTCRGAVFFGLLAAVGLTRSTFGPLWFCAVAAALFWIAPVPRRAIARAMALPLLILLLHTAKTPLYVGVGYGDAMLWPNLAKKVYAELPRREQRKLVRQKALSPAIRFEAFTDLGAMRDLRIEHAPTGIPALDEARAPNGRPNANALEYALVAERYSRRDALFLLKTYPKEYALAVLDALTQMPQVATNDTTLPRNPNFHKLAVLNAAVGWLALAPSGGFSATVLAGLLIAIGACLVSLVGKQARETPARRSLAAFAMLTIGYTTAVSVLVSWGDFPRYRFEVDGLYWMFTVLGVALFWRRLGGWRAGRGSPKPVG